MANIYDLSYPYLTVAQFQANSLGIDTSSISSTELNNILLTASIMCNEETNTNWGYKVIYDEPHDWETRGINSKWEGYPLYPFVRTITSFKLALSINSLNGELVYADVPITPVGPTAILQSGELPFTFGSVFLDSSRDYVQTTYILLEFGIYGAYPAKPLDPPLLLLSYTCGFDSGTVQSDGYSVTAPQWLQEATRLIAIGLITERSFDSQGMSGIDSAKQGEASFKRAKNSAFSLPDSAKRLLRQHRRTVIV